MSDQSIAAGASVDLEPLRHQLTHVLRMQAGDVVLLLDGSGREFLTELRTGGDLALSGTILQERAASGEPGVQLTLYQCALKNDKMEWVLQKGTELGVSRFVPVISERTIVRPAEKVARKADRWEAILREAAEQSGRGRIPALDAPMMWDEAVNHPGDDVLRIVPWENVDTSVRLAEAVHASVASESTEEVALLIGPEGGISDGEIDIASGRGWKEVTLGPRVLRAETAALAAVSIVMSELGEMA